MLLNTILLLALMGPHPNQDPSAKKLIEKMLVRYYTAKSMTGTIKLTVASEGASASLMTTLQFEKESKLYIYQQKLSANPDPGQPTKWLVTSDGNMFSYNVPNEKFEAAPGLRLVEPVHNARNGINLDFRAIYTAASKSLGDRSMPLDIAIAQKSDLEYRRNQWATFVVEGQKEVGGKSCYVVSGNFRFYLGADPVGKFQMLITDEGDLVQYVEEQNIAIGPERGARVVKVTNQWDVSLTVNGKVDPALFKVVLR